MANADRNPFKGPVSKWFGQLLNDIPREKAAFGGVPSLSQMSKWYNRPGIDLAKSWWANLTPEERLIEFAGILTPSAKGVKAVKPLQRSLFPIGMKIKKALQPYVNIITRKQPEDIIDLVPIRKGEALAPTTGFGKKGGIGPRKSEAIGAPFADPNQEFVTAEHFWYPKKHKFKKGMHPETKKITEINKAVEEFLSPYRSAPPTELQIKYPHKLDPVRHLGEPTQEFFEIYGGKSLKPKTERLNFKQWLLEQQSIQKKARQRGDLGGGITGFISDPGKRLAKRMKNVRYEGIQEGFPDEGIPNIHLFTALKGPAKGATFGIEKLDADELAKTLAEKMQEFK